jgi:hypothetical protein
MLRVEGDKSMKDRGVGGAEGLSLSDGHLLINVEHLLSICAPACKKRISDAINNECVIVYHCSYCKTESNSSGTTLPAT